VGFEYRIKASLPNDKLSKDTCTRAPFFHKSNAAGDQYEYRSATHLDDWPEVVVTILKNDVHVYCNDRAEVVTAVIGYLMIYFSAYSTTAVSIEEA
jgi:hypothetical protein